MPDLAAPDATNEQLSENARHKLSVVQYQLECGNVAATARKFRLSTKTVRSYVERYDPRDLRKLENKSRARKTQTTKTSLEVANAICALALQNPTLGGTAIAKLIKSPLQPPTPQTINRILNKRQLATGDQRWQEADRVGRRDHVWFLATKLNPIGKFVRSKNARVRDHKFTGDKPGEAIAFGVLKLGNLAGIGRVVICCVVDSYSSVAFASLHGSISEIPPTDLIDRARLFFDVLDLHVTRIKFHQSFFQTPQKKRALEKYFGDNGITQTDGADAERIKRQNPLFDKTKTPPEPSGFVQHFFRIARAEFFNARDRRQAHDLTALRVEFDDWLMNYNQFYPLQGYPTYGCTAQQMLMSYIHLMPGKHSDD